MASKAIVIKGLDASGSPLGKINFVVEPQDLTSQIKWEGKIAGKTTPARIFETQGYPSIKTYTNLQYISYGGSVGILDVTEFQGATIEIKCYPAYSTAPVEDGRASSGYVMNLFASAISKTASSAPTSENPMEDEGLSIIPVGTNVTYFTQKLSVFNMANAASSETQVTKQVVVPTVSSGHVYLIFTNNSKETEFSGYVKTI